MTSLARYHKFLFILSLTLLVTCKKESPEFPEPSERLSEALKRESEEGLNSKPVPKPAYEDEIYGDPKIFDSPRIQFVCQGKGDEKLGVFSTRLDGTDMRRVLDQKLLYTHGHTIDHIPVRSPDNKYLVVSMSAEGKDGGEVIKELFDLKDKTVKTIAKGFFVPHFMWTPDSKKIIFGLDGDLVEYNLDTDKLTKKPLIACIGIYLTKDGKQFLAIESTGYGIYDFNGKLIKRYKLKINSRGIDKDTNAVSLDGKLLLYYDWPNSYIVKTENPKEVLYIGEKKDFLYPVFSPDNQYIYHTTQILRRLNIRTGEEDLKLPNLCEGPLGEIRIINYK